MRVFLRLLEGRKEGRKNEGWKVDWKDGRKQEGWVTERRKERQVGRK